MNKIVKKKISLASLLTKQIHFKITNLIYFKNKF